MASYNRFEKARVLGARALQLAMGAPPLVKSMGALQPFEIAMREIGKGVTPITVLSN